MYLASGVLNTDSLQTTTGSNLLGSLGFIVELHIATPRLLLVIFIYIHSSTYVNMARMASLTSIFPHNSQKAHVNKID